MQISSVRSCYTLHRNVGNSTGKNTLELKVQLLLVKVCPTSTTMRNSRGHRQRSGRWVAFSRFASRCCPDLAGSRDLAVLLDAKRDQSLPFRLPSCFPGRFRECRWYLDTTLLPPKSTCFATRRSVASVLMHRGTSSYQRQSSRMPLD